MLLGKKKLEKATFFNFLLEVLLTGDYKTTTELSTPNGNVEGWCVYVSSPTIINLEVQEQTQLAVY